MILIVLLVAVLGLIAGSFLTSVVYRLSDLRSILKERSHCPHCKKELGLWDLIPLLGFVFLLGKCRYCGKKISWQYPLIESLTAILFVLTYLNFGISFQAAMIVIILMGLIVVAFYDLSQMLVPDEMLIVIAIFGLALILVPSIVNKTFQPVLYSLVSAAGYGGFILLLFVASKGKWIGFGDVKLAFLLGFILGFPETATGFFSAFLIGGFWGIIQLAIGKKELRDKVPLAPFLILGFIIAIFWGEKLLAWYLNMGM